MATVTPNFSWPVPTSTDLVKDGATAIEALGDSIDASLVDLKGGTTGQVLSKNSNTDMDFTWVTDPGGDITGVSVTSPLTGGGTSGSVTVGILSGTTSNLGAVQLSNSTSSTSTTLAATANAVKTSYDLAAAAVPKSTVTTAGDVIYATGSGTVTRLGIGTAGQVLKVNSGATAPEWGASAATSGLTLISSTAVSGATTHSFNNVFTSTYANYRVIISGLTVSTTAGEITFRYRASGTDTSANYVNQRIYGDGTSVGAGANTSGTDETWITALNTGFSNTAFATVEMYNPQVAVASAHSSQSIQWPGGLLSNFVIGYNTNTTQFDGFTLISSGGNIAATVRIYGYQNS